MDYNMGHCFSSIKKSKKQQQQEEVGVKEASNDTENASNIQDLKDTSDVTENASKTLHDHDKSSWIIG